MVQTPSGLSFVKTVHIGLLAFWLTKNHLGKTADLVSAGKERVDERPDLIRWVLFVIAMLGALMAVLGIADMLGEGMKARNLGRTALGLFIMFGTACLASA